LCLGFVIIKNVTIKFHFYNRGFPPPIHFNPIKFTSPTFALSFVRFKKLRIKTALHPQHGSGKLVSQLVGVFFLSLCLFVFLRFDRRWPRQITDKALLWACGGWGQRVEHKMDSERRGLDWISSHSLLVLHRHRRSRRRRIIDFVTWKLSAGEEAGGCKTAGDLL